MLSWWIAWLTVIFVISFTMSCCCRIPWWVTFGFLGFVFGYATALRISWSSANYEDPTLMDKALITGMNIMDKAADSIFTFLNCMPDEWVEMLKIDTIKKFIKERFKSTVEENLHDTSEEPEEEIYPEIDPEDKLKQYVVKRIREMDFEELKDFANRQE